MLAKELISPFHTTLKTSDTAQKALRIMEEYKVNHIPIVNNIEFLGLISEDDIYQINAPEEPIGNHQLSLVNSSIDQYQHIYDVMTIITNMNLSLVPITNKNNHYLGVITINDLIKYFSKTSAVLNPGGIIVIEVNENDYSMSEIAQIIESNNAKILSSFITSHQDSTKLEITLKINKIDIIPVLSTFGRYDYNVIASFSEPNTKNDLMDRYNSFMSWLNI